VSDSDIEVLLTKQAITEVLYRYCRGLDRMDRAMASSVWHPGGTADYGPMFAGTGEAFLDWVWQTHQGFLAQASSEAYSTVTLRLPPNGDRLVDVVDRGRYLDRWSLRNGCWAIDHRHFVEDFQALYDVPLNAATDGSATTGRRDERDPSFDLFPAA
jgi:hypothetical protein